VARFQQLSDEDVVAAREKIARGASLRSAAADIPCAQSSLSLQEGESGGSRFHSGHSSVMRTWWRQKGRWGDIFRGSSRVVFA
jgi:hypothetical protein